MRFILLWVALMSVFSYTIGQPIFVKNSLQEINAREGKIQLTLVRTWGGDEINDENQFFKFPGDVKVSQDGLIYIADSINNRIQVFDRKGNFKRSVGTAGQGPSDLLQPSSLDLDKNNNLIVSDSGNLRIQIFDSRGNYLNSFRFDNKRPTSIAVTKKNEIALYSFEKTFISSSLLYILDSKGKLLREIGKPPVKAKSIIENESLFFYLRQR
jgi:DNA-binding beta-propeller fold protein YncE